MFCINRFKGVFITIDLDENLTDGYDFTPLTSMVTVIIINYYYNELKV